MPLNALNKSLIQGILDHRARERTRYAHGIPSRIAYTRTFPLSVTMGIGSPYPILRCSCGRKRPHTGHSRPHETRCCGGTMVQRWSGYLECVLIQALLWAREVRAGFSGRIVRYGTSRLYEGILDHPAHPTVCEPAIVQPYVLPYIRAFYGDVRARVPIA